jgi:hypothetical protein
MAREQFNHEWEDPKKKKPPYKGTPKPKPGNNYNEQHNISMGGRKPDPHKNPEKPKPNPRNPYNQIHDASMTHKKDPHKNPEKPKGTEKPNPKKGYPTDDLFKKMGEQKASVKIEKIKKKTTESVLKEKMAAKEKLKKKSPLSRARALLPKTKKKKKK